MYCLLFVTQNWEGQGSNPWEQRGNCKKKDWESMNAKKKVDAKKVFADLLNRPEIIWSSNKNAPRMEMWQVIQWQFIQCHFNPCQFNPCQFNPCQFNPYQFNPCQFNPYQFNPCQITHANSTNAHSTHANSTHAKSPYDNLSGSSSWPLTIFGISTLTMTTPRSHYD